MRKGYDKKVCPRCGEALFDDMDVCYGCLYEFGEQVGPAEVPGMPPDTGDLLATIPLDEAWDEPPYEDVAAPLPGWILSVRTALCDVMVPVLAEGLVVGRDADCDVVLHDRCVSSRHLRFVPGDRGVEVSDLGSTNPATVNGAELREAALLYDGGSVELSGTLLVVKKADNGVEGRANASAACSAMLAEVE